MKRIISSILSVVMLLSIASVNFSVNAAAKWVPYAEDVNLNTTFSGTLNENQYITRTAGVSYFRVFRFNVPQNGNITFKFSAEKDLSLLGSYLFESTNTGDWIDEIDNEMEYDVSSRRYCSKETVSIKTGTYYLYIDSEFIDDTGVDLSCRFEFKASSSTPTTPSVEPTNPSTKYPTEPTVNVISEYSINDCSTYGRVTKYIGQKYQLQKSFFKNGVNSEIKINKNGMIVIDSSGIVTFKKAGFVTVDLWRKRNDGSEQTASYEFAVKKPSLNKTKVTLKRGKSFKLSIKGKVGKASFKSSKKSIATVSKSGKIKGKKKGKATITVKTNGNIKLKCKVKVK